MLASPPPMAPSPVPLSSPLTQLPLPLPPPIFSGPPRPPPRSTSQTTCLYIVFITVLLNGGTSAFWLRKLKLRAEDTPALMLREHGYVGES